MKKLTKLQKLKCAKRLQLEKNCATLHVKSPASITPSFVVDPIKFPSLTIGSKDAPSDFYCFWQNILQWYKWLISESWCSRLSCSFLEQKNTLNANFPVLLTFEGRISWWIQNERVYHCSTKFNFILTTEKYYISSTLDIVLHSDATYLYSFKFFSVFSLFSRLQSSIQFQKVSFQ